ncbi:MAG: hypothetical protein E3J21_22490 [Anaerolineales bacterium]|nr:MAG: hypothetical protein E3J21_22490 [Anaerolineales bacterium]
MNPPRHALFVGLVFNEQDEPAEVVYIGAVPHYVILDDGFRRHVEAETVDRQVLELLRQQILANRELVTQGMLSMLGKDDLFTKAMIDASVQNIDRHVDVLFEQGLPEDTRTWLGMLGFKVVVNVHGEVVRLDAPGQEDWGGE